LSINPPPPTFLLSEHPACVFAKETYFYQDKGPILGGKETCFRGKRPVFGRKRDPESILSYLLPGVHFIHGLLWIVLVAFALSKPSSPLSINFSLSLLDCQ
jgi:hypothetical protein